MKLKEKNEQRMPLYEGTKQIYAKPMTRGKYNKYRGWDISKDEDSNEKGYLVEYTNGGKPNHPEHEGYISWTPAPQFEDTYVKVDTTKETPNKLSGLMSFGLALQAAKQGKRIVREGWNGKGMFVYIVPAQEFKSLTPHAKKQFGDKTPHRAYFALKTAQNDIAMWSPSGSDALAEDWSILKS